MIHHRLRPLLLVLVATLIALGYCFAQVVNDSLWIKPSSLTEVGVHLPSYIKSVDEQLSSQAALPTHQELTLEWNSLAGNSTKTLRKEETEGQVLRGDFHLVERQEKIRGGSVSRPPMFIQDHIVAIAVADGNEVRGLVILWDPRSWHSEDVARGKRYDFITPSVRFKLWLPDDPAIRRVVFLRPVPGNNGKSHLKRIGDVLLESVH